LHLSFLSEYIHLTFHFLAEVLLSVVCSNCTADNGYNIKLTLLLSEATQHSTADRILLNSTQLSVMHHGRNELPHLERLRDRKSDNLFEKARILDYHVHNMIFSLG
jgi:hypothetical protein